MTQSFDSTNAQRRPSLPGGPVLAQPPSGASTEAETAGVRALSADAPQVQTLLAARAQAQPEESSQSAEDRSPETTSEGLSSRVHVEMLFESGIRSGQELLRRGATAAAIAAIVLPQVQSELNTQRIQDTLPCWISGLLHGLGGPEVAQRHVQAVLTALMHDSRLPVHIQQSCLHAIALALSGKNADAGVRIAYTARGEESLRDLTGPSGAEAGSTLAGGHNAGDPVEERSRRPAWDIRLQELMGGRLKTNEGQLQAWNNGLRGLHLDPLWRMDSGSRAPTLHSLYRSRLSGGAGEANALHQSTRRTAPASTSALSIQLSTPVVFESTSATAQPLAGANPAVLTTDDAALGESPPARPSMSSTGSDAGPQTASPSGGNAMPPDLHLGESAGPTQTSLTDLATVKPPASIRARASALRDQLQPIPDLMLAPKDELRECLRPARAGLSEDARCELDEALKGVRLCGITSTSELRQLADHVQAWRSDLLTLDDLVAELSDPKAMADARAGFTEAMNTDAEQRLAALQKQLVTTGSFMQRLLEDTSATLNIGGLTLTAAAGEPSLSWWLEGWIDQAYRRIPRLVLIERLIDHTLATLPKSLPDAPKPLPRPKADDDGEALMGWFEGELQRQWRSEDGAFDLALAEILVASGKRTGLATWKPGASDEPRERELQALQQHLADRGRIERILSEFPHKVGQLTEDEGEKHAFAMGLTARRARIRPEPLPGGAGQIDSTFTDLADMLDLISQHRDRRETEQQPPSGSSVSPLASAQAASDGSSRSRAASESSEG